MSDTLAPLHPEAVATRPPTRRRGRSVRDALLTTVVIVALVLLPLLTGTQIGYLQLAQYVLVGAVGGIGLTLLIGQAGQVSLAHPFFVLAGAVSYVVLAADRSPRYVGFGLPPLLAVVGAVVISGLLGLAFSPIVRRLRGIRLGAASLLLVFLGGWLGQWLERYTGGVSTGRAVPPFDLFGLTFADTRPPLVIAGVALQKEQRLWYLFLAFALVAYFLARGAVRSRIGRAWRAVRNDETVAAAMGVNVSRVKAGAFTVSASYAGAAGVMTALWLDVVRPDATEFTGTFSLTAAVAYLAVVVIGGLGSVPGAVVGAVVVFGLPQFLQLGMDRYGWLAGPQFAWLDVEVLSTFAFGLAIVLVLLSGPSRR